MSQEFNVDDLMKKVREAGKLAEESGRLIGRIEAMNELFTIFVSTDGNERENAMADYAKKCLKEYNDFCEEKDK